MKEKRYCVKARRKGVREPWSTWTEVDNYRLAEQHAEHVQEVGYSSKISVNEKGVKELWKILAKAGVINVTEQADVIFDAGFRLRSVVARQVANEIFREIYKILADADVKYEEESEGGNPIVGDIFNTVSEFRKIFLGGASDEEI